MSQAAAVPIATAIGTAEIRPAIDAVLNILNESVREKSLP